MIVLDSRCKPPVPAPSETEFKTPSKILAELNEYNQQHKEQSKLKDQLPKPKEPLDYRFSIGQLPKWAKNMVLNFSLLAKCI